MARRVLGYVELVWTCDSCGTRNPGPIRSCTACGAPQPIEVKFEHVDAATFNFIKDEALIPSKSGPDKHAPIATPIWLNANCLKCGGDLTVGGDQPSCWHGCRRLPIPPQAGQAGQVLREQTAGAQNRCPNGRLLSEFCY